MKPYYTELGITIYHGRMEDILPALPSFDLLLTDPPYGIGENHRKQRRRGGLVLQRNKGKKLGGSRVNPKDYGENDWDKAPATPDQIELMRSKAEHQVIWGGNYFTLPPSPCWLVWNKENGSTDFADAELAWTNLKKAVRMFSYRWNGMLQADMKNREVRVHPTHKPVALMEWVLGMVPAASVIDPMMGGGSTLVAARNRGRTAVGIDSVEQYCEAAARRLQQKVLLTF